MNGEPGGSAAPLWHRLWTLECSYWHDVDFNSGHTAADYYTEEALFDAGVPGSLFRGREEIAGFYTRRRTLGPRTTLHLVHNFELTHSDQESAHSRSIITLYASEGSAPRATSNPAVMTVCRNEFRLSGDGEWRIHSRVNKPCFVDPGQLPAIPNTQS